jgi:hypothetical protein
MEDNPSHDDINHAILSRTLHLEYDENTYFSKGIFKYVLEHLDDPHILFRVALYGYYRKEYKWSNEQTEEFFQLHKHNSVKWDDGFHVYYYDWGKGKNRITRNPMHFPNLDHVQPKSIDVNKNGPENFRIRCKRLNESKSDANSDNERRASIVDLFKDMNAEGQQVILSYLNTIKKEIDKTFNCSTSNKII